MLKLREKFLLTFSLVLVLLGLASCTANPATAVKIRFEEQKVHLLKGETMKLQPTIQAGSEVGQIKLVWSSDDETIATVADGEVTGVAAGETQIKVCLEGKSVVYDKIVVQVVDTYLPTFEFTTETTEIKDNEELQLTYELTEPEVSNGEEVVITWSSSDEEVATVEEGLVTAHKAGEVVITATVSNSDESKDYEFALTIGYSEFQIEFDLDGGQFGEFTYDSFANYMVDLFNNSTDPGKKEVTIETFHTNSHPNIKGVFDKAEVLEELQWFFIFAKEEITANCEANGVSEHLAETVDLLERLIDGDTTAIGGSYANGRSVFRHFMHNLFNKDHESAGSTEGAYLKYTTDFSLEENQARFVRVLSNLPEYYTYGQELPVPTKEGYEFLGWYAGENKVEKVTSDLEVVAKWRVFEYTIKYETNGGIIEPLVDMSAAEVEQEFALTDYLTYAAATGFKAALITNVPAKFWNYIVLQESGIEGVYKIAQIVSGSANVTESYVYTIAWHSALTDADAKAVLDGMLAKAADYAGHYVVFENLPAEKQADCSITVKVVKPESIKVIELAEKYEVGQEVILLPATKEGYNFLGWELNGELVDKIAAGTEGDLELVAKWEAIEYTLTLNADGGEMPKEVDLSTAEVEQEFALTDYLTYAAATGFKAALITNVPAKFWNYIVLQESGIEGVYKIAQIVSGSANVTESYVYTIAWHSALTDADAKAVLDGMLAKAADYAGHYVVFENLPAEKQADCSITVKVVKPESIGYKEPDYSFTAEEELELPVPTKEGFNFLGWYAGEVLVEKIAKGTIGNLELVAKWADINAEPTEYSLTLNLNSGILEDAPNKYVVADGLKLPTPTREGFEFLGWFDNAELTGEAIAEIAAGSKGDKELWAKWAEIVVEGGEFNITYELNGGEWPSEKVDSYEDFREAILSDFEAYFSSLAGKEVTINRVNENTDANTDNWHMTDFMGASYLYRDNIEAFFTTDETYAAKWGWVFDQLKADGIESDSAWAGYRSTVLRGWTHGFIYQSHYSKWPKGHDYSAMTFEQIADKCDVSVAVPGEAKYDSSKGLKLAEVSKEGYEFAGWYTTEDFSGAPLRSIKVGTTGDLKLYAKFIEIGAKLYVGLDKQYSSIKDALAAANDGDIIVLDAGEYELAEVINKSVTIMGPNADQPAPANANPEALIHVAKDIAGNLAAKNIVFNGVHLQGTGGGAGIPGISFQDGGSIENLTFKSCVISDTNTFLKFVNKESNLELVLDNCHIYSIGQFILWTTGSINKTIVKGCLVEGSTCGAVTNSAAALFRVRNGSLEAYNNVFVGDSANTPGYFECSAEQSFVKYNLFKGVRLFAHPTASNNIVFDENMYISIGGDVLEKAPAELVAGGTVKVDETVCKSEEELQFAYNKYLMTQYPDRYFPVSFDAAGGKIAGTCPVVYDSEAGIATLPAVERVGYVFLGWTLNGEVVESVPVGTSGELKLVAIWKEDALVVDGTTEDGHFATLADALAAAKDGETIIILAGEYADDATISLPNLVIKGPNAGIDAVDGARNPEAVIKGVWSVDAAATNLTIDGLSFTGNAQVKAANSESGAYEGLVFMNNKVYDTKAEVTAYDQWNRYGLDAFLDFKASSSGTNTKFEILNNEFKNVSAVVVLVNRVQHFVADGNSFVDFGQDAIRIEGGYVGGVIAVTNNKFVQNTAETGHIGFYLLSSSHQTLDTKVVVENNLFKQIGQAHTDVFTGAIGAGRFQEEKVVDWSIKGNVFDHCYDIMWLRNNGATADNFVCTVEDNQFLGLPHNYYYGSYRNTDSESTNPHLTKFGANYYEDNEGNVISDLSTQADKFKHLASYGTALTEKPTVGEVEAVKFYTISYDLVGGKTTESFVKEYTSLNNAPIALPKLEKTNHNFDGWLLNGELVKEIPANAKGDLHLVAQFTVLEGEIYTIELVPNKETPIWPSRPANNREEIIAELYADLYEWAQGNGETKSYEEYVAYIEGQLAAYADIKLRNTELGNYPAEDGSTEYFFNIPQYYQKWNGFFAEFNKAMLAVNSGQVFYTDTYAAMVRLYQFVSWSSTGQSYFNAYLSKMCAATQVLKEIPETYRGGQVVELPQLTLKNGLQFLGWYDNPEFTGDPITEISSTDTGNKKFYGKWEEEIVPTTFTINQISELLLFTTHQLEWTINPDNATNKEVEFFTSNEAIVSVSPKGLLTAHANGKATITVKVYGNRELDVVFDVEVYSNDIIEASFESDSYAVVGETLQINASITRKDKSKADVKWESLTPEIATVDEDGTVTAVKAGLAKIVASDPTNAELKVEFQVTVLAEKAAGIAEFLLNAHESNIFSQYNLGIGAGVPEYYKDIFGSVSKLLMNYDYQVDDSRKNMEKENNTGDYFDPITSVEFITVHYTGNMSSGADAKANANYFVGDNAVSIHYCTGNDGIYQALTHDLGGYHAGDSGALEVVGAFKWMPTGVKVAAGDPLYPNFTISTDFYYEINGQKTSIPMPKPWNYSGRGTDHILNADGTISSQANFGQSGFQNREPESFMNDMSLPFKVVGDEYYMGTTWWCYTQVYEGRICSTGGNRNSIGIESCVDKGSDLWYTWQITAQLVARLLNQYNLEMTRVRGHHFFTAKDCPQPMLENNLCIWWKFLELVEAERELLNEYSDYEITFVSNNPDIVDNHGRIIAQPSETTCVSYTITFTKDGQSQSITLSSIINGLYVGR